MVMRFSFGTTTTGVVWFGVRADEGSRPPAWSSPQLNARTFVIPGAFPPRSETQIVSVGPSTLRWRLYFPTLDDFHSMMAKLGTTDTLTVLANVQSHKGTYREIHGTGYVDLPDTLLLALDANAPEIDGQIEATATFQRHIDPETGLVVS